jgi:hypothetical protein
MMSSVISTMNRTTITSDALVSLYDLVRCTACNPVLSQHHDAAIRSSWPPTSPLTRVFCLQLLSVTAGKDLVQEPFLAEGGAPALLHAMYVCVLSTSQSYLSL